MLCPVKHLQVLINGIMEQAIQLIIIVSAWSCEAEPSHTDSVHHMQQVLDVRLSVGVLFTLSFS